MKRIVIWAIMVLLAMTLFMPYTMAEKKQTIVVFGDSQTAKPGYVEQLSKRVNPKKYTVVKFGQGGSGSVGMAMVQGGISLYAEPFTIPAGTETVEISLTNNLHNEGMGVLGMQSLSGLNPCEIGGVPGRITTEHDEKFEELHWYFTRAKAGKEIVFSRPVMIKTNAMDYQGNILVLWLGTNDSYHQEDAEVLANRLIRTLDCMIDYNRADQYIVMGLTSKYYCRIVEEVNILLAEKYGYHFLDIRDYLLKYGFEDAGIIPTDQDIADIQDGEIPGSLRADLVHFNEAGFTVIGDLLYQKGLDLGYWK